jgi:hypothetical protein
MEKCVSFWIDLLRTLIHIAPRSRCFHFAAKQERFRSRIINIEETVGEKSNFEIRMIGFPQKIFFQHSTNSKDQKFSVKSRLIQ